MYTVDDDNKDLYEEEEYETSRWDNYKGLIFKIIIIILCIIVLVWLIKALKNNRTVVDDGSVHIANVEKVRLAAENYFFIQKNKNKTSYVTLGELKNKNFIGDVVDVNNKVCSDSASRVDLVSEPDDYKMTIKLSCSAADKDEVFYYHKNTLACLNCSGKTYMDGKTVVINDDDKNENDNTDDIIYSFTCNSWSDWSKTRVNDPGLSEKVKTMVQGVKYGTKTTYGEWSSYTTTPIEASNNLEVETKVVSEQVWSSPLTSSEIDTSNLNIHVLSTETINESGNSCSDGYVENGICYSKKTKTGNLTYGEYNSGKYIIKKDLCEGVKTLPNKDGKYVLTYINCEYNEQLGKVSSGHSYTLYTYQTLETINVVYYRSRSVIETNEPDKYTDKKYDEKELPAGFIKVPGTEEYYYSYKLNTCEK